MKDKYIHIPVLLPFVIACFSKNYGGKYLDATLGLGGHSYYILRSLNPEILIGIDRDEEALEIAKKRLNHFKDIVLTYHSEYSKIAFLFGEKEILFDGVLIDLGISSYQLDSSRGFSFKNDDPIDMRMNKKESLRAIDIIKNSSFEELIEILIKGGERKSIYKIAKELFYRKEEINTTGDLVRILRNVGNRKDTAKRLARCFQALRIAVNNELQELEDFLEIVPKYINKGGRLVSIAYHSKEDRLIKMKQKDWIKNKNAKKMFSHVIKANKKEREKNPRSRSALLRCTEFI